MTKLHSYVLSVAGVDGVMQQLCTATPTETEYALTEQINRIAKVLTILKFRGTVIFQIAADTGDLCWTSTITFTDDIPQGVWNTVNHHFNGQ